MYLWHMDEFRDYQTKKGNYRVQINEIENKNGSSPVLSLQQPGLLLWCKFDPWHGKFHKLWVWQKRKEKLQRIKTKKGCFLKRKNDKPHEADHGEKKKDGS